MLTTPHAAVGAALGASIGNPVLVIPAALASHFILDGVPHWQETLAPYIPTKATYLRVPLDIILAISITALAAYWQPQHLAAIWIGACAANVPDLDTVVLIIPKLKQGLVARYWDWHCNIQRETSSLWGIIPQLLVTAIGIMIAYVV